MTLREEERLEYFYLIELIFSIILGVAFWLTYNIYLGVLAFGVAMAISLLINDVTFYELGIDGVAFFGVLSLLAVGIGTFREYGIVTFVIALSIELFLVLISAYNATR